MKKLKFNEDSKVYTDRRVLFNLILDEHDDDIGKLVSIRPIDEKKTFLGVYLGKIATSFKTEYQENFTALLISHSAYNPAIFVPDLGRIVFGYESWWDVIENPEQFHEITDQDIDNTKMMYLLQALTMKEVLQNVKEVLQDVDETT